MGSRLRGPGAKAASTAFIIFPGHVFVDVKDPALWPKIRKIVYVEGVITNDGEPLACRLGLVETVRQRQIDGDFDFVPLKKYSGKLTGVLTIAPGPSIGCKVRSIVALPWRRYRVEYASVVPRETVADKAVA